LALPFHAVVTLEDGADPFTAAASPVGAAGTVGGGGGAGGAACVCPVATLEYDELPTSLNARTR
jgi:hypothetical protein